MDIQENVLLSTLTTFRTGGPARFVLTAYSESDIGKAVQFAEEKKLPLIPLGSGSNLCAPDEGVAAVFLKVRMDEVHFTTEASNILVTAEAGLSWDALAHKAAEEGWWGIENLSGIPGTVGASVVQNIGAYGAAIGESVSSVQAFDTKEKLMKTFIPSECAFGYRSSIFKKETDRYIIVRVTLILKKDPHPNLSYRDLKNRFENDANPSLFAIREAVLSIRKEKFPPLSEYGTAGSFFLNPIISESDVAALSEKYPEMPFFPLPEGGVKVPLAWLFDKVLSLKGLRVGGAFIWDKQPLVISAVAGASSADVYALAEKIAHMLKEKTDIVVTPEVRLFGKEKKIILSA